MANAWSRNLISDYYGTRIHSVTLANGEASEWLTIPHHQDVSIQAYGTFGGATLILEGANNPNDVEGTTLKDALGNSISLTSEDLVQVLPGAYQIRVSCSGGGGTTAIKVAVKAARSH